MRDYKRIREICNKLASAWEKVPDMRLGQLIWNGLIEDDIFYVEDEKFIELFEEYCNKLIGEVENEKP